MVTHMLRIVEDTASNLTLTLTNRYFEAAARGDRCTIDFSECHLRDALWLTYTQRAQVLMQPMRLAMASILDATLFWLLPQPAFQVELCKRPWSDWLQMILMDQIEYRQRLVKVHTHAGSTILDEKELDALLANEELRETANVVI